MLDWVSVLWNSKEDEVAAIDETLEEKTKREQRAIDREVKKQEKAAKAKEKRNFRIEKIKAITAKALAVGTKRKWLVFMIAAAVIAYLVIVKGMSGGGLLEMVKGLL
jgi:hypothetical protein